MGAIEEFIPDGAGQSSGDMRKKCKGRKEFKNQPSSLTTVIPSFFEIPILFLRIITFLLVI
jgi:hypothetical protein